MLKSFAERFCCYNQGISAGFYSFRIGPAASGPQIPFCSLCRKIHTPAWFSLLFMVYRDYPVSMALCNHYILMKTFIQYDGSLLGLEPVRVFRVSPSSSLLM
jgi:hypothetical protein